MPQANYKPTEKQVQVAICDYLSLAVRQGRVITWWRAHAAHAHVGMATDRVRRLVCNFPGCPDILGVLPGGKLLALEVKSSQSAPRRDEQEKIIGQWQDAGCVASFVWSVDQVKALVDAHWDKHLESIAGARVLHHLARVLRDMTEVQR